MVVEDRTFQGFLFLVSALHQDPLTLQERKGELMPGREGEKSGRFILKPQSTFALFNDRL